MSELVTITKTYPPSQKYQYQLPLGDLLARIEGHLDHNPNDRRWQEMDNASRLMEHYRDWVANIIKK